MQILGLIPARGDSKGVLRKNIKLLCGRPLLQYTAEAALGAAGLSRVVLSTDDAEIAEVGKRCGLDVPFIRPAELALDNTPTLPVVKHAIRRLEDYGEVFDAVCLLQPTNPLRSSELIDQCIELFVSKQADTILSVLPVPHHYNPHWVYFQNENGFLQLSTGDKEPIPNRQNLTEALHREGSVYVTKVKTIAEKDSLYGDRVIGYPVELEESVNIDTLDDWKRAEALLKAKNKC